MTDERNCRNSCLVTEARHTQLLERVLRNCYLEESRSKLPGVEKIHLASNDSEVLKRDRERKEKGKDHADNPRGACESSLNEGVKVLLQKPKTDKLSP